MSKYLLEIGTEELPAKFSHSVLEQFKSLIEFELDKKSIKFEQIVVTSTPRRIVLLLEGLVDYAEDAFGPFLSSILSSAWSTNPSKNNTILLGVEVQITLSNLISFFSNSNFIREFIWLITEWEKFAGNSSVPISSKYFDKKKLWLLQL